MRGVGQDRRRIKLSCGYALFQNAARAEIADKITRPCRQNLDKGLLVLNSDGADGRFVQTTSPAQKRQKPACLGPIIPPDRDGKPCAWPELLAVAPLWFGVRRQKVLWRGSLRPVQPKISGGDDRRCMGGYQPFGEPGLFFAWFFVPTRVRQQAILVQLVDVLCGWRRCPLCRDLGPLQKTLGLFCGFLRDDHRRYPLASGPPGAPGPVQQTFGVCRQIGMNNKAEVWQVNTPRGHIRRDADTRAPVAHRLQRVGPFGLGQLTGQANHRKPAIGQARGQVIDRRTGVGKDNRAGGIMEPQQVENGVFLILLRHADRLICDVGMLFGLATGIDPLGVPLKLLCKFGDHRRHRGRKHQRAAFCGRLVQHEFQVFAKAEIQHFVGLIQNDGAQSGHIQRPAHDVVAQSARRANNDMSTARQCPPLVPHVHTADTGRNQRAGLGIKPAQLAHDLKGQFAGWRHDQRQWRLGAGEMCFRSQKRGCQSQPEADSLARSGLRRHQQISHCQFRVGYGLLHRGQCIIAAFGKRLRERGVHVRIYPSEGRAHRTWMSVDRREC